MKTNSAKSVIKAALAAVALISGTPTRVLAGQPFISTFDETYIDASRCAVPLLVHLQGTMILQTIPGTGKFTFNFIQTADYTNLENGKTATAKLAGPGYQTDTGSFVYQGVLLLHTANGTVVDAGIEEQVFEYDPVTGTVALVTVRHLGTGTDAGEVNDAMCAALQ